jgi:hypothetical protein
VIFEYVSAILFVGSVFLIALLIITVINKIFVEEFFKNRRDFKRLQEMYPKRAIYKLPWIKGAKPTKFKEDDLVSFKDDPDKAYRVDLIMKHGHRIGNYYVPGYCIVRIDDYSFYRDIFEEDLVEYVPYMKYDPTQQEDLDSDI